MKSPFVSYVGWLLIFAALGFYAYGIVEAIALSWNDSPIDDTKYPPILSATISSIQAIFLTNLGVVLGISIAKPDSAVARQIMFSNGNSTGIARAIPEPLAIKEKLQLFALVIYIISLIACLITWAANKFSSESTDVVSIISESGKMFIGVVLAYLTAVLGGNNLKTN